ncbi:MAG: patatin-like phospholipase family protein [Candidatus Omnitrophica bacterium]|nr:patatin-like phospholipase family protein [Candidatus Omnitrophota bacterium]
MGAVIKKWTSRILAIIFLMAVLSIQGCATLRPRNAVPLDFDGKVTISGMPDIRTDIDNPDPIVMQKSLVDSFKQEDKDAYPSSGSGVKIYPVLAISGGGANGAYGAGLLKGWSEEGSRPLFKIITGVSSGSIIALYTFVGKEYDVALERFFTTMSTKDIMRQKNFFSIMLGDSLFSSAPLAKKISAIVDGKLMTKVAEEHKRGRRLFVGTVNLDAQEFVVWDMGALACKGGSDSLLMFRKILLASCSLPMTFSPVHFKVSDVTGELYDEMHVDGGTIRGVFYINRLTKNMEGAAKLFGVDPSKYRPQIYILSNSYMSPIRQQVKDDLVGISVRSLDTVVAAANNGDIYRLYATAKKRGLDFNLAYIPSDFKPDPKELFDKKEMQRLFKRGYDDAVNGYEWHKTPPGYAAEEEGPEKTE